MDSDHTRRHIRDASVLERAGRHRFCPPLPESDNVRFGGCPHAVRFDGSPVQIQQTALGRSVDLLLFTN